MNPTKGCSAQRRTSASRWKIHPTNGDVTTSTDHSGPQKPRAVRSSSSPFTSNPTSSPPRPTANSSNVAGSLSKEATPTLEFWPSKPGVSGGTCGSAQVAPGPGGSRAHRYSNATSQTTSSATSPVHPTPSPRSIPRGSAPSRGPDNQARAARQPRRTAATNLPTTTSTGPTPAGSGARAANHYHPRIASPTADPSNVARRSGTARAAVEEEGRYYLVSDDHDSDEDVNSSFGGTPPQHAPRRDAAEHPRCRSDGDDDNDDADGGADEGDEGSYDEEDEEQAVQRYMDSGAANLQSSSSNEDSSPIHSRTSLTRAAQSIATPEAPTALAGLDSTLSQTSSLTTPRHVPEVPTRASISTTTSYGRLSSSVATPMMSSAALGPGGCLPPPPNLSLRAAAAMTRSSPGLWRNGSGSTTATATANASAANTATAATTSTAAAAPATDSQRCRCLSLYDVFFLDRERKLWLVDDLVLAKCLEYVRLMGYEHPLLSRDRTLNRPSIWSSSAAVPSPLEDCLLPLSPLGDAAGQAGLCRDGVFRPFRLRSGEPPRSALQQRVAGVSPLFLEYAEAARWISEQEYVIGTILMCCACAEKPHSNAVSRLPSGASEHYSTPLHPPSYTGQQLRKRPAIPPTVHPILWAAQLVTSQHATWGGFDSFADTWEAQVRLVLYRAAPAHQCVFPATGDDGVVFISDMDGGNLARVERAIEPYYYYLWLEPDNGSDKRIWFRFAVAGAPEGRTLRFRLLNAAPHAKLYRQNGMMPVWRDGLSQPHWTVVEQCSFRTTNGDADGEVSFSIVPRNSTETIQVAFCAPYTYADLLCHMCNWHHLVRNSACKIRFEERVLCRTPDGRKLHLLIITSPTAVVNTWKGGSGGASSGAFVSSGTPTTSASGALVDIRGPYANFTTGKKAILVSGRVHPGEVTASHALHGLVSFLLSSDPRAARLREHFLFFIVPMLNPDGVSRGHSRLDQYGNNLNRCYNHPDAATQPTVHSLKKVFEHLQRTFRERFIMYLDFHSHASQSSGFMFGNHLPLEVQHWNMVFPKVVELHARDVFSFSLCRFGRIHMSSKDGASRVLFGNSLIHSYTVELAYFTDRRMYSDTFVAMNNGGSVIFDDAASAAQYPAPSPAPQAPGPKPRGLSVPPANAAARSAANSQPAVVAAGNRRKRSNTVRGRRSNSEGTGQRGRRDRADAARPVPPFPRNMLNSIAIPTVLCQSAMVGQACMLALMDYCSVGSRASNELATYGGMERVLLEVKRQMRHRKVSLRKPIAPASGSSAAPQLIFKQY